MITGIINILDQVTPKVGTSYGLCTIETDDSGTKRVIRYVGGDQANLVSGESWCYWRVTGSVKQKRSAIDGCSGATQFTFPLRYVLCEERTVCGPESLNALAMTMRGLGKYIERSLQAMIVEMNTASVECDPSRGRQELPDATPPLKLAIGYIDLVVDVTADSCLLNCEPITVTLP